MTDMNRIKTELQNVGISINDIYDLVNTSKPYPSAIPVLLNLLQQGIDDIHLKEGIVRALAVKEAIGKACPILISEYKRIPKNNFMFRWVIGNTIYVTITENYLESILEIVLDKENGISRQMFVLALGKVKSERAEDALIKLLDDEEVTPHALEALGRLKSKKARQKINSLTSHSNLLIRKEAKKALKKINNFYHEI